MDPADGDAGDIAADAEPDYSEPHPATEGLLIGEAVSPLSAAQQKAYLALIIRGASMSSACKALGLSVSSVLESIETDAAFCDQVDRIGQLLSQNVAAALYRAAMEGNVTAQVFFLTNRPPLEWHSGRAGGGITVDIRELSNEELDELLGG